MQAREGECNRALERWLLLVPPPTPHPDAVDAPDSFPSTPVTLTALAARLSFSTLIFEASAPRSTCSLVECKIGSAWKEQGKWVSGSFGAEGLSRWVAWKKVKLRVERGCQQHHDTEVTLLRQVGELDKRIHLFGKTGVIGLVAVAALCYFVLGLHNGSSPRTPAAPLPRLPRFSLQPVPAQLLTWSCRLNHVRLVFTFASACRLIGAARCDALVA